MPKNVWILATSQALFMALGVFVIFIGGIIGQNLAPMKSLSTLPVAMIVIGTASAIVPIIQIMEKIGRKRTFLGVCIYTIFVIILAICSLYLKSFVLFCLSIFLLGVATATMNQFRFAAIESVATDKVATATAMVLLGGLASAFLGSEIVVIGRYYFKVEFVGSFLLLSLLFVFAFILLSFFKNTNVQTVHEQSTGRKLGQIIKQKIFIVAISSAAIGYVVMSYIMTATPMSMHVMDGFSLEDTKFVIQSHVIAMFLPSLFTAFIVKFIGVSKMMLLGIIAYFICVIIAYIGHEFVNYWVSLILLGIGWNFLFIGGTSLLTRSYFDNEKFKVQAANDFLIFSLQAIASLSAGWFVFNFGWDTVLLSTVPLLVLQLFILLWWLNHPKV